MERRRREVAQFGRWAEETAYDAYQASIRKGQDLKLVSPHDVLRHGAELLKLKPSKEAQARRVGSGPSKPATESLETRLDSSPAAKKIAGGLARTAGNATGLVRGGVHAVEGLVDGAVFVNRLLDPYDVLKSAPGETAGEQLGRSVLNVGRSAVEYVQTGVADPASVARDIKEKGRQWRRELDPSATPVAPAFVGELKRNFDIGQNQGELVFDVGSLIVGGPAAKTVGKLGSVSKAATVEKYLAQGFSPKGAAYLAEPYVRKGHHFAAQRWKLPPGYSESVFNLLRPEGISRGDMYELHYRVDPRFHGTKLAAKAGGERWSGKAIGLEKYNLPGRIWYGSPAPLKARVGGLSGGAGAAVDAFEDQETGW